MSANESKPKQPSLWQALWWTALWAMVSMVVAAGVVGGSGYALVQWLTHGSHLLLALMATAALMLLQMVIGVRLAHAIFVLARRSVSVMLGLMALAVSLPMALAQLVLGPELLPLPILLWLGAWLALLPQLRHMRRKSAPRLPGPRRPPPPLRLVDVSEPDDPAA